MRSSREQLIFDHLPLAKRIAGSVARKCGAVDRRDDIFAACQLGLVEAANRYTGEMPFEAFAVPRIKGAAQDFLRSGDHLPRRVRKRLKSYARAVADGATSDAEISAAAGLTTKQLELVQFASQVNPVSFVERSVTDHSKRPDTATHVAQLRTRLRYAMTKMTPEYAQVLKLRFVYDVKPREIAAMTGTTQAAVSSSIYKALRQLRQRLQGVLPLDIPSDT